MRSELDDEITALEDKVKAEMLQQGVNELEGAGHIAKYAEYTTMRLMRLLSSAHSPNSLRNTPKRPPHVDSP